MNNPVYYNIIILCDHIRICGSSLTATPLCGAYLYTSFVTAIHILCRRDSVVIQLCLWIT